MGETRAPEPAGPENPPPENPRPENASPQNASPQNPPSASPPSASPPRPWPRGRRSLDPWSIWMHRSEELAAGRATGLPLPAWLRKTPGERRWPVTLSILVAIVLQVLLPSHLTHPLPRYVLPVLEGALLVGLNIANPFRIERRGPAVRAASIALILLMSVFNAASAVLLIRAILEGKSGTSAMPLLASGASIWATNVVAFALWYWEFDRGGPVLRAEATRRHPDLMFPQMASPELAPLDWEPQFVDYLYLSFTNATAFSPTDVMPLARWAKLTMLVQSAVSLAIGALVIARAINILK